MGDRSIVKSEPLSEQTTNSGTRLEQPEDHMLIEARRILVYARPAIGDVLLSTPLIRSLRRGYPDAKLDVLIQSGQESILTGNPDIDQVITVPPRPRGRVLVALLKRIGRGYDLGVTTSASDRAHLYLLIAARHRLAFTSNPKPYQLWKRWLMSATLEIDNDRHAVSDALRFAELLGIERHYDLVAPAATTPCPDLNLPSKDAAYAVLHLTPGAPFKRWSLDGWQRVARNLHDAGITPVLTGGGSTDEKAYVASAQEQMPTGTVNLAGRIDLGQLTEVIRGCAVYVGVDTVASHLAAAAGAPIVTLFGPTDPLRWGPWPLGYRGEHPERAQPSSGEIIILRGAHHCDRCEIGQCKKSRERKADCPDMLSITPEHVISAIDQILKRALPADPTSSRIVG